MMRIEKGLSSVAFCYFPRRWIFLLLMLTLMVFHFFSFSSLFYFTFCFFFFCECNVRWTFFVRIWKCENQSNLKNPRDWTKEKLFANVLLCLQEMWSQRVYVCGYFVFSFFSFSRFCSFFYYFFFFFICRFCPNEFVWENCCCCWFNGIDTSAHNCTVSNKWWCKRKCWHQALYAPVWIKLG